MHRSALFGIAFLGLGLSLELAVCLAADEPKPLHLIVLLAPGEDQVTEIPFPLALDAQEGTRQIFVRNADAAAKDPLAGVRFYVQLQDDQKVPIGTATLTSEKASTPEVSIPGNGRLTAVQLKIAGIDRFGAFNGPLIATWDAQAIKLVDLKVERKAKPKLEVFDAPTGDGAITLKTDMPAFTRSIRVRAMDDADVKINSIAILPFLATNASLVIAKDLVFKEDDGKAFDFSTALAKGKSVTIDFSARFEETAAYAGILRIDYEGGTLQKKIEITRERPNPAFEVLGVDTVYGTLSWWCNAPIKWRFGVHETGGKPRGLNVPRLVNFGLDEEVQKGQSDYQEPVFRQGDAPLTSPWTLHAGEITPLTMELSGLSSSGKYTGTVQVGQADGQSKTETIHLLVKTSCLVACFYILVGVGISMIVRLAVNRWQPQLSRLKRASELSTELTRIEKAAEPADAEEKQVLESFRERWNTMNRQIDDGKFTEADAIEADLGRKLTVFPEWLNTYRRWKAVKPPSIVEGLKDRLEAVKKFLTTPSTDAAAADTQRSELKKIDTEISQAITTDLSKALDEFEEQVQARKKLAATPHTDKERLDDDVLKHLPPARDALAKGNLDVYRQEFAQARGAYVLFLADELGAKLAAPERPIGFQAEDNEAEWSTLQGEVTTLLDQAREHATDDPDLAAQHYQAAYTQYLTALLAGAYRVVESTKQLIDAQAALLGDKKDGFLQRVVDWGNTLYDARKPLKAGQLQSAYDLYKAAADGLIKLAADLRSNRAGNVQMGIVGGQQVDLQAAADAAPGQSVIGPATEAITRQIAQLWVSPHLTVEQIKFRRFALEGILAIAVIVMALSLGLKLLWASDPTWGSANDLLTAFLWGLGLHQVSGATIGSSQGLLDKFVTPSDGKK